MKCGDINNPGGIGRTSNGDPCKRDVAPGLTRCNLHGATVAAKIKAEQMLAQSRIPACEALFEVIEQWQRDLCPTCQHPSGDTDMLRTIIKAAQVILDRTGMGPRSTIELTKQSDGDLALDLLTDSERDALLEHITAVEAIKAAVRVRQLGPTQIT